MTDDTITFVVVTDCTDGLLGECVASEAATVIKVNPIGNIQTDVFLSQLAGLNRGGYGLEDAQTQCLIIYFKLVLLLELDYDPEFCNVHNPENIWQMLQSVKLASISSLRNIISHQGIGDFAGEETKGQVVDDSGEEEEEEGSLNFLGRQAPVLKKDMEEAGNQSTGLEKIEHKIVKGTLPYQKVNGNRIYLKVAEDFTEEKLYHLMDFLDRLIAAPNKLIFSDFKLNGDQLSFRASHLPRLNTKNEKHLTSAESIAKAVYKRRKDIQKMSGVYVDETGIGSGEEVVPVESENRDRFFIPVLVVSAFTIVLLLSVMAAHQIWEHRKKSHKVPEISFKNYGGTGLLAYEDLCRHRMSSQEPAGKISSQSHHSSTSSWIEEPVGQSTLDISTGHVILTFLRDYLKDASKIEEEWDTLDGYVNPSGIASIAEKEENMAKSRNPNCLPYDDTLISIQSMISRADTSAFINASAIHDCDPKQANYIVTQSPLPNTIADFWEMIWEQGTVLIVNLTNNGDLREGRCMQYWPGSGSEIQGSFEVILRIHLVSEHIWSEDYMVRSFYLKNLKTNETQTVTQFHFLTWPKDGVPLNTKALLDFRRKVNKSYRGRAAPIVVHSTDGTGRTGTYCLLDMVLNRVTRGLKEMNVASSLEHLRDQRPGMVKTCEQYKMVFVCLAEEITAIVAALS